MNELVAQILAVGLTVGQLFTPPPEDFKERPEDIKERLDPVKDQAAINKILKDGCTLVIQELRKEKFDPDEFLEKQKQGQNQSQQQSRSSFQEEDYVVPGSEAASEQNPPQASPNPGPSHSPISPTGATPATTNQRKSLKQSLKEKLDMPTLLAAYKQFCKGETIANSPVKMEDVVTAYNKALANLPDPSTLRNIRLPGLTFLLDRDGKPFTELYEGDNRRVWISIKDLPAHVKQAFISAEDQNFYKHNGLELRGIIRAFIFNVTNESSNTLQGGSTITQQVAKNWLVGSEPTFDRKIREMVAASRLTRILSRDEILELYLNGVYFGKETSGIEMAARSYFGKPAAELTISEAAALAGMVQGPNVNNPKRYPERVEERRKYVLRRMKEDDPNFSAQEYVKQVASKPNFIDFVPPRTRAAHYYVREVRNAAQEALKVDTLTKGSYVIRTTVHPGLQRVAEESLQNHLAAYEERTKGPRREPRVKFTGPQGSLADDLDTYNNSWQEALANAEPKLHDVRWPLAVVLQPYGASVKTKGGKTEKSTTVKVGLSDGRNGRIIPLTGLDPKIAQQLKLYDLIFVQVDETKKPVTAKLKVPPQVQGAVVVLEAKTGRVLAMTGGFSYVASNFNRATRAERQPGSTLKPFIYLAALNMGFRPDTLIPNLPIDLDPVDRRSRKKWRPHNYDYDVGGNVTLRTAIERSMNLPTVRMMSHLGPTHPQGLQTVCRTAEKLGIYSEGMDCVDYSTALGAKETHLLSMAVAYATVANDGLMPVPHFIESIEERGQEIYQRPRFGLEPVPSINRVSFYQLRRILEGTVSERGTASRIQNLKGYVAGKTGTTDNYHDAWFVGFTKDLVVAVWVGYDNDKIYSSLGPGRTGAQVALPIAESILRSSFEVYRQKEFLPDAPDEIRHLIREEPLENNRAGLRPGDLRNVFRLHNEFPPDILLNGYERNLPILYDPNGDEPDEEAATEEESSPTHAREDDPNASGGTYEYAEGSAGEPVSRPPQFRSDESGSLTASPFPGPYMQGPYPGDGASVAPMNSPREDAAFGPLRF